MFTRPICIFLLLLTVYLIFANVRALNKSRRIQKETNSTQDLQEG
jgi:putative tricarboxylic transport membrane protein